MAAGYKLDDGRYDEKYIKEEKKWSIFEHLFSSKSAKTTSYKYGFLKSILDNLDYVDSDLYLTFDQLFLRFTELYWNLVLKYKLRQKKISKDNKRSSIETILEEAVKEHGIPVGTSFIELPDNIKDDISHKVKIKCKENVVGALYKDTKSLLYSFNKKEEWIKLNPLIYDFLINHRFKIEKLNNTEWATFLKKVNDDLDTVNLLSMIEEGIKEKKIMDILATNNKELYSNEGINNYNLIELLCIKAIVHKIQISSNKIEINDISAKILSYYWSIKFNNNNTKHMNQDLNSIKSSLISKYGLTEISSENDIEQIINYIQDKNIKLKLFSITKASLQKISKIPQDIIYDDKLKNIFKKLLLNNQELIVIKSNKSVVINKQWFDYLRNETNSKHIIDEMIRNKLNNNHDNKIKSSEEFTNKAEGSLAIDNTSNNDFIKMSELEKRLKFHVNLNKKQYYCLEESLIWLEMDLGKYEELHSDYVAYIREKSVKLAATKFPIVSCVNLIFTAIYRYNEEDASGFWPETFDNSNYNYQRDVPFVMNCLKKLISYYKIDYGKRKYLQKKNMTLVFSQIYIPDISLRKIYSAIYSYYFRGNKVSKPINRIDFLSNNEYRLDKPGIFFLSRDEQFKDSFYDLVEMVRNSINNHENSQPYDFPDRFYKALNYWKNNEKKELDSNTVEFYISFPQICLDNVNDSIYINMPVQKSRTYSDEDLGWNITIDKKKETIYGRLIRKNNGDYLVLEEKYKLTSPFNSISIEYFYNNKPQRSWDFTMNNNIIIFDKTGELIKNNTLSRDGCYLGILKGIDIDMDCVIDSHLFKGWDDYIFYYLELSQYPYNKLYIDDNNSISIEDKPVIKMLNFKLLFENLNTQSIYTTTNIYESIGTINIIAPYIRLEDIKVTCFNIGSSGESIEKVDITRLSVNCIQVNVDNNIKLGIYNIIIKYKDKTIYTETFVYDCYSRVKSCEVNYNKEPIVRSIEIYGNNDVEILSYDITTKIHKNNNQYLVKTRNKSVSKFIYKYRSTKIPIYKIVRPIKYELTGLEDVIEGIGTDKIIEITKEVMQGRSINLYIRNLDYRHEYLTYNLIMFDEISNNEITITEKLKFGQEINWDFNGFQDRLMNFKDVSVGLQILDRDDNLITMIPVLKIKEQIKMYNFKQEIIRDRLTISWDEEQDNKQRRLSLYNVTMPSEAPLEYDLKDGIRNLELDLSEIYSGVYTPVLRFIKGSSLFDIRDSNQQFFKKEDISITIVNEHGYNDTSAQAQLQKCIWMICKNDYESLNLLINRLDFNKVDLATILYSIIQMKNFSNTDDKTERISFINSIYKILEETFNHTDKDNLVNIIIGLADDFNRNDIKFLINSVIAFDKNNYCSSRTIDSIAEIDLISALCGLENRKSQLSNNIIIQCSKQFDHELLLPEIFRYPDKIFDIIRYEMNTISGFWNWLIGHSNKYLLNAKYNYSKARMFRIYEEENEISSYKVLGSTLDDMVDNINNNNINQGSRLLSQRPSDMHVDKDIYDSMIRLIRENDQSQFKDSIIAAFIAVSKPSAYSNKEYFKLVLTSVMSNQKDIFNRYRAYFKLMFI